MFPLPLDFLPQLYILPDDGVICLDTFCLGGIPRAGKSYLTLTVASKFGYCDEGPALSLFFTDTSNSLHGEAIQAFSRSTQLHEVIELPENKL